MRTIGEDVHESMLPDCVCRRRDDLEAEVARLREELNSVASDRTDIWHQLTTERAAHEQTRAELERWRAAWGEIGPQTPDEVPVFLRESERVQGQVAACEIAKARARVAELESELDETESAGGETQARALAAESALASARTLVLEMHHYQSRLPTDLVYRLRAWLAAHLTPGAETSNG